MEIGFDPAKNKLNIARHGVEIALAESFEIETALIEIDDRHDYGEIRYIAIGYLAERLHVMVFTIRDQTMRVISLRKANRKERERYEGS